MPKTELLLPYVTHEEAVAIGWDEHTVTQLHLATFVLNMEKIYAEHGLSLPDAPTNA